MNTMTHTIALVTGGSRGIGRAIALALAHQGADVVVAARDQASIDVVAAEIRALGRRALAIATDVTDPAQIEHLRAQITEKLGPVNILVNNAGIADSHKFLGHDDALWHRILNINLNSVYYVTKAFVPAMVERRWGRIINIASLYAKTGGRYVAAYTASKHAVLGLTRALAVEFVEKQITVNAICPGYVDTPMTKTSIQQTMQRTGMSEAEASKFFADLSPQRRLIEPDEVAAVAVMLASDQARGITGQAISVDGGSVMF
jgi:NAD(P)-dependent dehydrogenase (short-subunit alcohol dehydrogenase family)